MFFTILFGMLISLGTPIFYRYPINNNNSVYAYPFFTSNKPNNGNTAWNQWLNNPSKNAVINSTSPMVGNLSWNITLPTGNTATLPDTGIPNMPEMIDYNHSIIVGGYNTSYLYSINDTDGNINWIFYAGNGYTFNLSAVVSHNTVMAVANSNVNKNAIVYGINATTGKNLTFISLYNIATSKKNFVSASPLLASDNDGSYGFIAIWSYSKKKEAVFSFNITSSGVTYVATSGWNSNGPIYNGLSYYGSPFSIYATSTTAGSSTHFTLQYIFKADGTFGSFNTYGNSYDEWSYSSPIAFSYSGNKEIDYVYYYENTHHGLWEIDTYNYTTGGLSQLYYEYLFNGSSGNVPPQYNFTNSTPLYYNGDFFMIVNDYNGSSDNNVLLNFTYYDLTFNTNSYAMPARQFNLGKYPSYTNPVISNGIIYTSDGNIIYALNTTNFNVLWEYNTGSWIYSSPIIAHGSLYVYNSAGNVLCFNTPKLNGNISYTINGQSTGSRTVPSGGNLSLFVNTTWYNSSSLSNVSVYNTEVVFNSLGFGSFSNKQTSYKSFTGTSAPAEATWTAPIVYQNTSFLIRIYVSTGNNKSYFYPHVYYELFYVSPAKSLGVTTTAN
ncbi:MAG: PQQ-binding-like beta-propeller repeat protein, partial [Thermoplasmata archaeon]